MSDVNLTVQEGSDVYLSLTETPAVVSVTNPLVAAASFSVTVGTSVTVSNFPATQGISGTVTANVPILDPLSTPNTLVADDGGNVPNFGLQIGFIRDDDSFQLVKNTDPLPVSGTVTASLSSANLNSVTVGVRGSVTVSNFPATQVVSVSNFPSSSSVTIGGFSTSSLPPSTVTVGNTVTVALDSNSLSALENVTVTVGAAVTVAGFSTSSLPPSTVTVANTVTINGTVTANVIGLNYSNGQAPAQLPIREDFDSTPFVVVGPSTTPEPFPISGTVTVSNVAGFNIPTHDFKSFAYTSGNLTQIAYKTGGASGTTVGILTLAYDGSGNLTSMTRT